MTTKPSLQNLNGWWFYFRCFADLFRWVLVLLNEVEEEGVRGG